MDIQKMLIKEFSLKDFQVENTVKLIDDGNTIPFIARYRKELTGSLDDQVLRELSDRLSYLRGLEKRKQEVRDSIENQGMLTEEIGTQIERALTLSEVEDIYRPFKPKRKTRASVAKEKGLEPLASTLLAQQKDTPDPLILAEQYINEEKGVQTAQQALDGAMDIIAEQVSDNAQIRKELRAYLLREAQIITKAATTEDSVYAMYYDYHEPVAKIPGHRILAIDRGEREEKLKVSVEVPDNVAKDKICRQILSEPCSSTQTVMQACDDAYDRLIFPSLEREVRNFLTDNACEQAIGLFSVNLRNLLMQPPVKGTVTLGLDPAYRTGCKIAVVDDTGKVLTTTVVYPTPPQNKVEEAKQKLTALIETYHVTTIAIGNGTASRESEQFVADLIKEQSHPVSYMVVSESGASVYSASKLAAEEFPEYDVSLRSAVSIARRLQDPLAELVKIDPKAIGVGQYQHDMPQNRLSQALGGVVEDCVNNVGVDLNTASHSLLSYVAGINASVAKNIVIHREENGAFSSRKQLLSVNKLGKKAFEQCAGFLRVVESENVLDNTSVHPESYEAAKKLLSLCGFTLEDVRQARLQDLSGRIERMGVQEVSEQIGVGIPTLLDIVTALTKPGRDPREELPPPLLRSDVLELKDLKEGMVLNGTVRNVCDFGAFVDIGVHDDGLVHISQLADRFVKHPSDVVKVGDVVTVKVLGVDTAKKRVSLTMKGIS